MTITYTTESDAAKRIIEAWRTSPAEGSIINSDLTVDEKAQLLQAIHSIKDGVVVEFDQLVMGEDRTWTGVRVMADPGATTVAIKV